MIRLKKIHYLTGGYTCLVMVILTKLCGLSFSCYQCTLCIMSGVGWVVSHSKCILEVAAPELHSSSVVDLQVNSLDKTQVCKYLSSLHIFTFYL